MGWRQEEQTSSFIWKVSEGMQDCYGERPAHSDLPHLDSKPRCGPKWPKRWPSHGVLQRPCTGSSENKRWPSLFAFELNFLNFFHIERKTWNEKWDQDSRIWEEFRERVIRENRDTRETRQRPETTETKEKESEVQNVQVDRWSIPKTMGNSSRLPVQNTTVRTVTGYFDISHFTFHILRTPLGYFCVIFVLFSYWYIFI